MTKDKIPRRLGMTRIRFLTPFGMTGDAQDDKNKDPSLRSG